MGSEGYFINQFLVTRTNKRTDEWYSTKIHPHPPTPNVSIRSHPPPNPLLPHISHNRGGSYANRMKIAIEIVKQCREAVGPDFIIVYRLSMLDLVEVGTTHSIHR